MAFSLDTIVARAKRRGFVYPWSDIYGGLANAWDYGPYWALLRKNICDSIIKTFVQERDDIVLMDAAVLMNPKVREASGHVAWFNDPLIDDKKTWERFRADELIEEKIWEEQKTLSDKEILQKIQKEVDKSIKSLVPWSRTYKQQKKFIITYYPNNPNTKKRADWTDVRKFSLMLSTQLWVVEGQGEKVRLRPETAQWIYVNFKNLRDTMRPRIPFGAIQIGKAFRNEVTPGNFIFRTREFEQAEMQYFIEPGDNEKYFAMFEELYRDFRANKIWLKKENLRQRDHAPDELAHYASKARDFEYKFPRWRWELQGIHDRGDFDLSNHMKYSRVDMQYHDPVTGKRYVPHIIETALWIGRAIVTAMIDAYDEETYKDANGKEASRVVVRFNKNLSPIKFAVLPLIKKDENIVKMAHDIFKTLSKNYMCEFDNSGNIGKSYRRQDEIGTPYCITIDHQSLEDGTVTVRERDSMKQERKKIEDITF